MAHAYNRFHPEQSEIAMNTGIQIERWPIDRLIPRANTPRTHSSEQVAQIAGSIKEWGWTNPILVGADNDIIAGHARLMAARKLGLTEVPVVVLAHLSEAQRRALVIADNQLALNSRWDEELLRIELDLLKDADYNLNLLGLEDEELKRTARGHGIAADLLILAPVNLKKHAIPPDYRSILFTFGNGFGSAERPRESGVPCGARVQANLLDHPQFQDLPHFGRI